jgi:aminoglycoside phosphotransferase (APT) family kinase protein
MTALTTSELASVAAAMTQAGTAPARSLRASLIAGGRSNLTYVLTDGATRWILRTPPREGRTVSAHDVAREHRVTAALGNTDVPVASAVLLCEDEQALGVPFTVSAFVDGQALRFADDLAGYDDRRLAEVVGNLLTTLATLHRVDHVAVGLSDFGRPDGYASRQLRRWSGQWETVGVNEHRALATSVIEGLARSMPTQSATAIVHGDFRIDNTLVSNTGIAAVVDWELSTIGDPVADVAMMCAYRHQPFDLVVGQPGAWTSPRLPDADGLAAGYEAAGGVTLAEWEFHQALACFKIAVIAAGIDHRRRAGSGSGPGFDTAGAAVAPYLELAAISLGASA